MTVATSTTDSMNHQQSSHKQNTSSDDRPSPRHCHLVKWPDFEGYGFNLHAEKHKTGQFVGKVDAESPAQSAGLREGDRIIEVNGVNIMNENHRQVVERIKAIPNETKLLVIDEAGDAWYKERSIVIKGNQDNIIYSKTVCRTLPDQDKVDGCTTTLNSESDESNAISRQLTQSPVISPSDVDEEVTTEPIPDLVLNGVHEDDDEVCDSTVDETVVSQVQVSASVEMSAQSTSLTSTCQEDEINVKTVAGNTLITGEASSSLSTTSTVPSTIITVKCDTPIVLNETVTCKQEQIGEETAKIVLGPESESSSPLNTSSSSDNCNKEIVNNILNNNSVNQNNNNNTEYVKSKFNVNEANNNQTLSQSPKVEDEVNSINDLPVTANVTVANKLPSVTIDTMDEKERVASIPASPTSIKSATSSNASSNGTSSTTSNGYKRCSLNGIDPSLEESLNMSVSQIRQFLSQKKKTDPKKVPMDLKQKYNIISSM